MSVVFYDSIGDFMRTLPAKSKTGRGRSEGESWDGNQSYEQARSNLLTGRPENTRKSDKLLTQLEECGIEIEVPILDTGRTGFSPCVPAFIAGSPDAMFCMDAQPMDSTPVKIMIGVTVSAGVTAERARNRGIAMLALARKLSMIRPCELWVFTDMNGKDTKDGTGPCAIPVIKIESSPLDMATASYALTDVGFLRKLAFEWGEPYGFTGSWAWRDDPTSNYYNNRLREVLKAGPDDVVLPGGYLYDKLLDKPVEWVNNEVRKFLAKREEKELAS